MPSWPEGKQVQLINWADVYRLTPAAEPGAAIRVELSYPGPCHRPDRRPVLIAQEDKATGRPPAGMGAGSPSSPHPDQFEPAPPGCAVPVVSQPTMARQQPATIRCRGRPV